METIIRVAIRTFGCKLNQYESMGLQEALENAGFSVVSHLEAADFYIINTCTVTGRTDRRSRQATRQALQVNPAAGIIITGCGAQRDFQEFAKMTNVRAVIGNREKNRISEILTELMNRNSNILEISDLEKAPFERLSISRFRNYTRAFVKIQEGCNRSCSYCVIPSVRGPSRSQKLELVIGDIELLVNKGFHEIVLTGIDLGTYGFDLHPKCDLTTLITRIEQIRLLGRVRLSSIEPMEFNTDLINKVTGSEKICSHFHIPLQSGCNRVLKRMNRSYSCEEYSAIVSMIRKNAPHACIGADVIVGFPGETEVDFSETFRFIEENPIDYLHVFSFSIRKGTRAATFPGQNPPEIIKQRSHTLRELGIVKAKRYEVPYDRDELVCDSSG